jgi:hypothetical protein
LGAHCGAFQGPDEDTEFCETVMDSTKEIFQACIRVGNGESDKIAEQ